VNSIAEALLGAYSLVVGADAKLIEIVALSLMVSLSAVFFASLLALPLGAAVAVTRFRGRRVLIG
jgi:tungstate transport system permease protein